MALRRQLAAQDAYLKPVLDLIPANATNEQIYFYIWAQEDSISNRVPVPTHFNLKCVKILKSWIVPEDGDPDDPVGTVDPVEPVVEPVDAVDPVDPVAEPVDAVDPVEPVVEPVNSVDPVEPVVEPVDAVDPVEPVVELVDRSDFNALRLRPLAYKPIHFQDLIKFASNRKQIFTPEAIEKVNDLLDISIPNILRYFLDKIKTYPIYQQYALAVVYFLHIEHSYYNKRVFLNFISDGPTPPAANESIRACWARWGSTAAAQVSIPTLPTSAIENQRTIGNVQPKSIGVTANESIRASSSADLRDASQEPHTVPAPPTSATENIISVRRPRTRQRTTVRNVQPKRISLTADKLIRSRWDRW